MQQVSQSAPLFESRLRGLKKIHQGKVRDIYDVDAEHMLIVTTDRLSAFDVVLPDPIPFKGQVLTQISLFWFAKTKELVANHLSDLAVEDVVADADERAQLAGRAMVVRKLKALPIEPPDRPGGRDPDSTEPAPIAERMERARDVAATIGAK
jgi:phosphoribosylaminoimidazole-succinocarboxamide synthase